MAEQTIDRTDPLIIPDSEHHIGLSIRGQLEVFFVDGETLNCADVRGLSAVRSSKQVEILPDGRPSIAVTRLMTHFHSNETGLLIQQNPARLNLGRLTGINPGGPDALLPADVTFDQYLILSLRGKLYINMEPLVMAAKAITEFPPVGTTFLSQTPTVFYDVDELEGGLDARDPGSAVPRLALASTSVCGSHVTGSIEVPVD